MARTEPLLTESHRLPNGVVVRVHGEIDYNRSPDLRVALMGVLQANPGKVVIDLSAVPYMDSSGVATLIEALQVQRRNNQKLVLCCMQPKVRGIFEIARLHTVFTVAPDTKAAEEL